MSTHPALRFLATAAFSAFLLLGTSGAEAARSKKPAKKAEPPATPVVTAPPTPAELAAAAATSALHPAKAFPAYEGLAFGKDLDALTQYMRARMEREVRPQMLATPDVRQRDRLQAEAESKVEEFSKSHVEFRGQATGYDVSILSGEFRHGARQEMRTHHTTDDVHGYFLLSEGTLWKLIRQQDTDSGPFEDLLTRLRTAYGKPAQVEMRTIYRDGEAVQIPERATWDDGTFTVQAVDMGAIYKSQVVKWALKSVEDPIAATGRRGWGVDIKEQYKTDDVLRDIMAPEDDPSVDSIVDRLLDDTAPRKPPKPAPKRAEK